MEKYAFGVDIGGTSVKIGLFTAAGELLDDWNVKTVTDNGGAQILKDISDSINLKILTENISKDDIEGIGVGVPGPVLADGTVVTAVNLGWGRFNIHDELSELTGLKVKAGNDANVAALGELWKGGGKGYSSMVMVTLGTGVGGGAIIDGKIIAGSHGCAAEIGHIPVKDFDEETETCGCGKRGCLEQYASATGIVRVTKDHLKNNPDIASCLRDLEDITAKDVLDEYKKGDEAAVTVIETVFKYLGRALASVSAVLDPDVFVIGGGVSAAGEAVISCIRKYYQIYAFPSSKDTAFNLAELQNRAGIYGGVKLVL